MRWVETVSSDVVNLSSRARHSSLRNTYKTCVGTQRRPSLRGLTLFSILEGKHRVEEMSNEFGNPFDEIMNNTDEGDLLPSHYTYGINIPTTLLVINILWTFSRTVYVS